MSSKVDDEFERYIDSPGKQQQLFKRTLLIVSISQIFGGAGLAAGITVGALLARDMFGTDAYGGLPIALFTVGSAGAAFLVGRLSQRFGRRTGLVAGFIAGGLGASGIVLAAITNNIFLLLASLFIYGAGMSSNLQARYAGTDLANSKQRGTAVSVALVSTTFGAVAGPFSVDILGGFALSIGIPALAGPFLLAAVAFFLAGVILYVFLRPDPFILAKRIQAYNIEHKTSSTSLESIDLTKTKRGIAVGATIMILTQMVMIAIMTMTPLHMEHHGHGLHEIGIVIGCHLGAMYLPSLVTGILVDKVGRTVMAIASGATLLLAGIVAALAPGDSFLVLLLALCLLGLGWNFGLISGTALIIDSTEPETRAKTQGTVDVLYALAGASGGAMSGMVVAGSSFATLSLAGGLLSLLLIPVVIWSLRGRRE
ncbi:MFS transporter [Bacillus alkalicellulosilyticus]|uniref:MFS transporter n=1 Tax=Alkalihalobacterium alkalicellulosilyticum TaxID=1912214 RepID=UPI000998C2EC|nr:MFS transporter [Bacillus alkalicellulosilyticus]